MDSCRLMLINLFSFVDKPFTEEAKINYIKLYEVAYENQRLMDNLVDLEIEAVDKIINKIEKDDIKEHIKATELKMWQEIRQVASDGRRTGSGITALGDMLAALGLNYDSEEGITIAGKVMKVKMKGELDCSIDLAVLRGSFKGWDHSKEFSFSGPKMGGLLESTKGGNAFFQMLLEELPEQVLRMIEVGRRNVSWSTIAPAGSVSILTQTTSGCEPLFMPYYTRRKKINHSDTESRVDFVDELGDKWQEFPVLHPKFKEWIEVHNSKDGTLEGVIHRHYDMENTNDLKHAFEKTPWYNSTANDIDWIKRIKMQSILQRFTSHSISSTLNLPEKVTEDQVAEIYLEAWKQGLKGVTVYREGSRSGVLISNEETKGDKGDRPESLPCDIFHTTSNGEKFTVLIGKKEGRPYEIFCIPENMATNYSSGTLIKEKEGGSYTLKCGESESYGVFKELTEKMSGEHQNLTRMWSLMLKHGIPISEIVTQINKTSDIITAFSKAVSRVLSKYIEDGTSAKATCEDCGSNEVIFQEGCFTCKSCGSSACG